MADHDVVGFDDMPPPMHVSDEERRAALAAGAPKVPRRAVAWGFVVAAILALGGTIGEHFVSAAGLNPTSSATTTTTVVTGDGGLSPSSALLSFERLAPVAAPAVPLTDQRGQRLSLGSERGRVVVLTFFDASCADACPVIATELRRADADLGARRRDVVFVTVNTDPLRLAAAPEPPAVTATGLGGLANWHYVTGSLRTLNPLWNKFGISISVYETTKAVVHNDALYLIDPAGRVVSRGSPFSDESRHGVFHLPPSLERVAGNGLASAIAAILGHRS